MGMRRESDQLNGMKFLRTHLEPALTGGREWQHQPHDHVLREKESFTFTKTAKSFTAFLL